MAETRMVIDISQLEEAHNTSNRQWLADTFAQACQVIEAGGTVNIMQQLSGSAKELVAIVDDQRSLEFYRRKYADLANTQIP